MSKNEVVIHTGMQTFVSFTSNKTISYKENVTAFMFSSCQMGCSERMYGALHFQKNCASNEILHAEKVNTCKIFYEKKNFKIAKKGNIEFYV